MQKQLKKQLTGVCAAALCVMSAQALPFLQLDIGNGVYVGGSEETVFNTSNPFTLYALVDSSQKNSYASGLTYHLSAAIVPKQSAGPTPNIGSFSIDGVTYTSANLSYGGTLPPHGVFDTFYTELTFTTLPGKATPYNSQDNPGGPQDSATGTLLYRAFNVDVSGLNPDYHLHFDLWTYDKKDKLAFAPFSHDAQSNGGNGHNVPDGGTTAMLLGVALSGLAMLRRTFKQ